MIYAAPNVGHHLGEEPYNNRSQKEKIICTSVSSSKQKADLNRQIEELKYSFPDHVVYKDIGSGLNYKRQQFTALLERVYRGLVSEIVVVYRERLCRYRFELIESLCTFHGTKIVVHHASDTDGGDQTELSEDLLAV